MEENHNQLITDQRQQRPSYWYISSFYTVDMDIYISFAHSVCPPFTNIKDSARIIKNNFISKNTKDPFFSLLTLGPNQDEDDNIQNYNTNTNNNTSTNNTTTPIESVTVSQIALGELVSMGFDQQQASQALRVCGNDVEQAISYLVSFSTWT